MRILVVGGAGFIGLDVSLYLAKRGFQVSIIDINRPSENILDKYNIRFEQIDMTSENVIEFIRNTDVIIHSAWDFSEDVKKSFTVNVLGTINLLEKAVNFNVKQFIFLSSAVVYGKPVNIPIKENDPLLVEESRALLHAITKLAVEKTLYYYYKEKNLPYTIFRIWWAYNDSRAPGRSFREVIKKILNNEMIEVPKDAGGSAVHNEDIARVIEYSIDNKEAFGEIFNIASFSFTWEEVFQECIKISGSTSKIVLVDEKEFKGSPFFMGRWFLDTRKIKERLKFKSDEENAKARFYGAVQKMLKEFSYR